MEYVENNIKLFNVIAIVSCPSIDNNRQYLKAQYVVLKFVGQQITKSNIMERGKRVMKRILNKDVSTAYRQSS